MVRVGVRRLIVDRSDLREWADSLGVTDLLERALADVGR
jgi:hypothetical protein